MADLLYGPDGPSEHDLKLVGDVAGKRVLDLGCGDGNAAVALARDGAVVIAVDASPNRLARARRLAEDHEVRVEFREADLAELAFMRADSVDVVFSALAVDMAEDWARVFRQAQRVLKPNAPFVFSHAHPFAACVDGDRVVRAYSDAGSVTTQRWGETVTIHPRGLGDTFTDLTRAGFRVDALHEPRTASAGNLPALVVWRARKEGS
jgi:SAM-dependent methyltransferase